MFSKQLVLRLHYTHDRKIKKSQDSFKCMSKLKLTEPLPFETKVTNLAEQILLITGKNNNPYSADFLFS